MVVHCSVWVGGRSRTAHRNDNRPIENGRAFPRSHDLKLRQALNEVLMERVADAEAADTPRPRRPRLRWVTRNEAVHDQADAGRSVCGSGTLQATGALQRIMEHVEG